MINEELGKEVAAFNEVCNMTQRAPLLISAKAYIKERGEDILDYPEDVLVGFAIKVAEGLEAHYWQELCLHTRLAHESGLARGREERMKAKESIVQTVQCKNLVCGYPKAELIETHQVTAKIVRVAYECPRCGFRFEDTVEV